MKAALLGLLVLWTGASAQAPQGIARKTPPPGQSVGLADQPGSVTLPDGTRLVPASAPAAPSLWGGAASAPTGSANKEWYYQDSGPNGAGWYFYPGRGPYDLAYGAPKGFSPVDPTMARAAPAQPAQGGAVDLSKRTTLDGGDSIEFGPSEQGKLPTYFTKKEPKKDGADSGEAAALKSYAELLDKKAEEQTRIMQQFAANAATSGGSKSSDGLTVDPELALIQASINPRTGQPRQRASEISRSVGLAMVPAGTILHLRNVSRVETQLGGTCLAILERDVWDAQMRAIVLPRGSKVLGAIQMVSGEAQDRAAIVFRQIVDPNGDQVPLLVEQPAMNGIGMTGIEGSVNHHFGVKFGSAFAWGLISGMAGSGASSPASPGSNFGDVVRTNVASSFGQVGQTYLQQTANIRSDIEVAENTSMKIVIGSPIYLKPWKEVRPF